VRSTPGLGPIEPGRNTLVQLDQGLSPVLDIHAHRNRVPSTDQITQHN
jgi:hypothetical protein